MAVFCNPNYNICTIRISAYSNQFLKINIYKINLDLLVSSKIPRK